MITYVNSSNAEKYSVLFSAATQSLLAAGKLQPAKQNGVVMKDDTGLIIAEDPITTVEQYFSYLPDLIALGASDKVYDALRSEGRRYTMLPLDEAAFTVDANSRAIMVPSEFQANGVGVQGDKYAEILYFVVDRFFDITDLDTCDIYIQWTNAQGESGVSTPWVVDIESEPNKMIIGWALSSDITKYAGTLKFALRFFQWDDKLLSTIKYSWSTLTQTVTIKSALDFVFGSGKYMIEDEINEAITNRIVNSNTQLAGVAKAERPEYTINLVEYQDLNEDGTYPFEVQARSTDGGLISYYWRFIDHKGNEQTPNLGGADDPTGSKVSIEFRVVDTTLKNVPVLRESKKLFYERDYDDDNNEIYVATALPEDDYTVSLMTLYERVAVCEANRVGSYTAVAVNRLSGRNMAERKSTTCVVPMPSIPVIGTNVAERAHLGTGVAGSELGASAVTLKVSATNPEANGTNEGELIYVWYKRRIRPDGVETFGDTLNWAMDEDGKALTVNEADWERIEGAEAAQLILTNTTDAMANPQSIEGKYKVVIYNHKNLKYVNIGSAECRVSYKAVDPVIAYPRPDSDETKVDFSNETALRTQIKVELDETWTELWNISDDITYQWYQTMDDEPVVGGDIALTGATGSTFIPTSTGKFYCQVTNHKNDTTSSVVSQIFYVV